MNVLKRKIVLLTRISFKMMESLIFVFLMTLLVCSNAQQPSSPVLPFGYSNTYTQWLNQNQRGTNDIPRIPNYAVANNQGQRTTAQLWAPGEPERVYPSSPEAWLSSCLRTGCPLVGTHCVFFGSFCPRSVRGVPCSCQRGCRVENSFIPLGETRLMDDCNNVCFCRSLDGRATCTSRRC